jgi:hypothetical protein
MECRMYCIHEGTFSVQDQRQLHYIAIDYPKPKSLVSCGERGESIKYALLSSQKSRHRGLKLFYYRDNRRQTRSFHRVSTKVPFDAISGPLQYIVSIAVYATLSPLPICALMWTYGVIVYS